MRAALSLSKTPIAPQDETKAISDSSEESRQDSHWETREMIGTGEMKRHVVFDPGSVRMQKTVQDSLCPTSDRRSGELSTPLQNHVPTDCR